jgi:hypothetical protein
MPELPENRIRLSSAQVSSDLPGALHLAALSPVFVEDGNTLLGVVIGPGLWGRFTRMYEEADDRLAALDASERVLRGNFVEATDEVWERILGPDETG